jgi:hypothetical protein
VRLRNFVLSITLGTAITIGLVVALSLCAAPAEAQLSPASAAPALDHSDAISVALNYLKGQQLPNGSFNDDEFTTVRAVIAVAAARRPIRSMTSVSGYTPLDYLASRAITYTHAQTGTGPLKPGTAGQLAVAVVAGGGAPYNFGGMNIVHELTGTYNAATGAYSTTAVPASIVNQPWAVLGLAAVQETVPVSATDYLISLQNADGGWGFPGWGSDADTTAQVLQALIASGNAGPTHAKVLEGLDYLRSAQLDSGGWGWGSPSADSTAAAIQALVAAGYTPVTESWAHLPNPHTALLDLQQADGSFSGYVVVLSTADAIPGLAEAPLPILGRVQRANRALTWMKELQNPDGSWPTGGYGHPAGPTCDVVLSVAAAGFDPYTLRHSGGVTSVMDYLSATAAAFVNTSPDSAGKLAIAVEAAGGDAHDLGGVNIVHVLTSTWYSPTLGAFGDANNSWHQAFGILGLATAGETVPTSATQTLVDLQNLDGSWTDAWGFDKPGSTGLVLQALIAAGVPDTDTIIVSGTSSLRNEQNARGSWDAFGSPSANSTAYAMQGLLAAGEDLVADRWLRDGHGPYDALAALQKPDGPFTLGTDDDFFSTRQAVPALLGAYYPLVPGTLKPFTGVHRGPDPDRMVAAPPRAEWGDSLDVIIPLGSDLDADGSVELDWRVSGETAWVTNTTVHRGDGFYTAVLPLTLPVACEFQATFTDQDGVQYGAEIADTVVLSSTLEPIYTYLPFVIESQSL